MACTATIRRAEEIAIIDLAGRVTLGDGSCTLRQTVRDLIQQGERRILLNLVDVTYIDSAGMGELVSSYAAMTNRGGEIKLLHAANKVRDVLRATRLSLVLENFTDEAEALRSFARRATA